jgi:hypothetical protein
MSRSEGIADRWTDRAPALWAAPLAALFLASAGAGAAVAQEPAATASEPLVVLEADSIVRDDEADTITAEGNVEARYEGRVLRTKRLVYSLRDNTIRAQGGVEIIDPDGTVRYADELEVDQQLNTGFSTGFGARIAGGGTLAAAAAVRPAEGRNELQRFVYTACPICKIEGTDKTKGPTWTLRARSAVQNQNSKMISYRDVVFQFGAVPVIYLPYFSHPDPSSGPRSGLLGLRRRTRRRRLLPAPLRHQPRCPPARPLRRRKRPPDLADLHHRPERGDIQRAGAGIVPGAAGRGRSVHAAHPAGRRTRARRQRGPVERPAAVAGIDRLALPARWGRRQQPHHRRRRVAAPVMRLLSTPPSGR